MPTTKKKLVKKKVVSKDTKKNTGSKKELKTKSSYEIKTNKNLNPDEIYSILDSKGLNFTKNLLFSNEVRRLCRFASPAFKDDPYNEIEKTINFINS